MVIVIPSQNCHELKNFEGLFAIMKGLKENCKDSSPSWLIVSERISSLYYDLCEAVSSDGGYTRYRQELRVVNQSPCVPSLSECGPSTQSTCMHCIISTYNTYTHIHTLYNMYIRTYIWRAYIFCIRLFGVYTYIRIYIRTYIQYIHTCKHLKIMCVK